MEPFIRKYRPKGIKEVIGQNSAVEKLVNAIKSKKPALVYGKTGTGKTSSVYAIADELDYEIIELNASDFRDKDSINNIIGPALNQKSLFMKEKLILIDEIDGITGNKDRGGINAILNLIKNPKASVVITGNDIWDKKFYSLRKSCEVIRFNALNYLSIANILENICIKENIKYDKELLKKIARWSGGDARAAINDLQLVVQNNEIKNIDIIGERDKTDKITDALMRVFKTLDFRTAIESFNDVEENYDKIMLLIEENLPKEYKGEDLYNAFEKLSKADIFSKRIRRRQNWRYLVYIMFYLSVGIALSKKEKYKGFINYSTTSSRIKDLYFGKNKERDDRAMELARIMHCSKKEVLSLLPIIEVFEK